MKINPSDTSSFGTMKQSLSNNQESTTGDGLDIKVNSIVLSPTGDIRRTFYDRTFSKMAKGSLRGSIFALCAAAIGSGVLSLPYVLALCGWVLGICFILTGATAALWSNKILASMAVQEDLPNLSRLVNKAGGPILEKSLSWMIVIYMFGSLISYEIIITSLFKYIWVQFDKDNAQEINDSKTFSSY